MPDSSNSRPVKAAGQRTTRPSTMSALRTAHGFRLVMMGVPLLAASWALMWTQEMYLNPLFFVGTWVGATLLMYAGGEGYPGWRHHAVLTAISVPLWWWFELVNSRVGNWEYVTLHHYGSVQYFLLASLAFSTVVPALHSAWGVTIRRVRPPPAPAGLSRRRGHVAEASAGVGMLVMIFAVPDLFFPLVWVGPFLILDGLVGYGGGRSLTTELFRGEWRLAVAIGLAGLMCGFLWEFWNFWSVPKWIYHIAYVEFLHLFEMPVIGYLGYIPFAWSVYQLLQLRPLRHYLERQIQPRSA